MKKEFIENYKHKIMTPWGLITASKLKNQDDDKEPRWLLKYEELAALQIKNKPINLIDK